jgi:predicted nuclease of predicted toxin-antitoxin system
VKFVVDQNVSPLVAAGLREAGHDAVHTGDLGLQQASDTVVLARASHDGRIVISADTDFGTLLAASRADGPSVVLIRRPSDRSARQVLALILANLDAAADAIADGAIVVLEAERVRVRRLPLY